jgi:glycosyltransferase involved in cell wall biosynthesis
VKILQIHAGYRFAAGEDTVVATEAHALRDAGHTVEQFIVPNPAGAVAAVAALARSTDNRAIAKRVGRLIDEFAPDIVHVHNTWFAISSSPVRIAARRGIPVVMTLHNYRLGCLGTDLFRDGDICTACVGRSPWNGVVHGCYRDSRLLSAVQAVEVMTNRTRRVLTDGVTTFVAPAEFMAARLVDIGVPADRLVVKPHFTSDPGPRPAPPSASNEVLFVGRLAPGKGAETLLRAWTDATSRPAGRSDLELIVIGDGPSAPALHSGASSSIRFEGWRTREQVLERLLGARALAFPSEWYEPFGMVLIEALSTGLPIVTSNASGAATIAGSPDELVFPSRDAGSLATALGRLDDDRFVDLVGAASRQRFEDVFSEPAGLVALERLYADTLDRAAVRR